MVTSPCPLLLKVERKMRWVGKETIIEHQSGTRGLFAIFYRFGGHMPLFLATLFYVNFLSYDTLQNITSHNYYMMRQAFYEWSCCGIRWITSSSCDEAGAS